MPRRLVLVVAPLLAAALLSLLAALKLGNVPLGWRELAAALAGEDGGAAALASMPLGLSAALVSVNAFLGALVSMLLVFDLSRLSDDSPARRLLTGVSWPPGGAR